MDALMRAMLKTGAQPHDMAMFIRFNVYWRFGGMSKWSNDHQLVGAY